MKPRLVESAAPSTPVKVYCGQCRFFRERYERHGTSMPICRHPYAVYPVEGWQGRTRLRRSPEDRNAYNACPDFVALSWHERLRRLGLALSVVGGILGLVWYGLPVWHWMTHGTP